MEYTHILQSTRGEVGRRNATGLAGAGIYMHASEPLYLYIVVTAKIENQSGGSARLDHITVTREEGNKLLLPVTY